MITLELLSSTIKSAIETISEAIKLIEQIVQKGSKVNSFVKSSKEKKRLKNLLALILEQRYLQGALPGTLRMYYNDHQNHHWISAINSISKLNDIIAQILEILERENGDFSIICRDAFENLLFGMKDRKSIYKALIELPPPTTEEDFKMILEIANYYELLINQLKEADRSIASYLTDGKKTTIHYRISPYVLIKDYNIAPQDAKEFVIRNFLDLYKDFE